MKYGDSDRFREAGRVSTELSEASPDLLVQLLSTAAQSAELRELFSGADRAEESSRVEALGDPARAAACEAEADRVAKNVVESAGAAKTGSAMAPRQVAGPTLEMTGPDVQRAAADGGGGAVGDYDAIQQARGGGRPLPESSRAPMEQALGADFSGVRVHDDARADELNRSFHARAFTTGRDIFFKQGEYAPDSEAGKELIAHELAHVVQQSGRSAVQFKLTPEAQQALDTAIVEQKSPYEETRKETDEIVPETEQSELLSLPGASKAHKKLVDFLRAFLLKSYVTVGRSDPTGLRQKYEAIDANPKLKSAKQKQAAKKKYLKRAIVTRNVFAPLIKKGAAAPETKSFLEAEFGLSQSLATDKEQKDELAKGPRIDVRSTFAGAKGGRRAHLFIVYTGAEGKQIYFRGGPGGDGNVKANYGAYTPGTVDYDPSAPSVTVMRGDGCKQHLDGLFAACGSVNAMKVPYVNVTAKGLVQSVMGYFKLPVRLGEGGDISSLFLAGENCNATAYTILTNAGIPTRKPGGLHPGWGCMLGTVLKEAKGKALEEDTAGPGQPLQIRGKLKNGVNVFFDRLRQEKGPDTLAPCTPVEVYPHYGPLKTMRKIKYGDGKIGFVVKTALEERGASGLPFRIDREDWMATELWLFDSDSVFETIYGSHDVQVLDHSFTGPKGPNDNRLVAIKNTFAQYKSLKDTEPAFRVPANVLKRA